MVAGARRARRNAAALAGACGAVLAGTAEGLLVQDPCCEVFKHVPADFGPVFTGEGGVTGKLVWSSEDPFLCDPVMAPSTMLSGAVALGMRGGCHFVDKVLNAQARGAVAVIVSNSPERPEGEGGVTMTAEGDEQYLVEIPAVFISMETHLDLSELKGHNGVVWVTINGTGSFQGDPFDASPLFLQSILFMLQLLLVVWSMVAVFSLFNWIKSRLARRKRLEIVRKLPTRTYRAETEGLESPIEPESMDELAVENGSSLGADRKPTHGRHLRIPQREEGDVELEVMRSYSADDVEPLACDASAASLGSSGARITDYYNCESCVICICNFEDGERITVLPCGHGYHKECIEPWLVSKSALCPICKQSILPSGDSRSLSEIASSDNQVNQDSDEVQSRSIIVLVAGVVAITVGSSLVYILHLYD